MADLSEFEDELLDIAHWQKKTPARDGSSKGGGRARRQVATVSSDEEDDRDAEDGEDGEEGRRAGGRGDQDDDEDEEEYGAESGDEPAGKERKGKSSQKVPVKKRSGGRAQDSDKDDDSDEDDDDDDDDDKRDYDSDLSFGSDLYKGREDKKALMAMTELEREMILAERAEKREQVLSFKKRQREKREAEAGVQGQERRDERRPKAAPPARGNRTSHSNALEELRRKRERRDAVTASERRHLSPPKRRRKSPSVSLSDRDEESEDEESRSGRSRSRSPSRSPSRSRSRSASRSRSRSVSGYRSDAGESEDDDDRRKPEPEAEIDDIQKIVIRRGKLAKWFMEPFFEEVVGGCLVRLGIGTDANNNPQYRLVEVHGVDARDVSKTYKFEGRTTYKWLDVKFGDMRARWQMTRVSDKPPTERDVREWFRELDRVGISRPTLSDIDEKCQQLNKVATFKYTPELVKQMVMEKRQAGERPRNLAMERERLRKEIDVLRGLNETEEIDRVQQQLTELETFMQTQKHANDTRGARLANMNKKNREQNFKNAAESQNFDGKDGVQDTLDPFSRRWTRSQNYYKKPDAKGGDAAIPDVKQVESAKPVVAGGEVVVGSLVDSRVQQQETPRVVAVHNFELPIRLDALERFGYGKGTAAGFMARKMRLETTCGVQIEPLDPRRKRVKLTIDDYQRRQQLK